MYIHCLVIEMQLKAALEIGASGNDWIIPIPSPIRRSLSCMILEKLSHTRISGKCLSFSICKIRITIVIICLRLLSPMFITVIPLIFFYHYYNLPPMSTASCFTNVK